MSAGKFNISKYAADYGAGTAIHPIQVQPETELLIIDDAPNTPPTEDATSPISARSSGGRRQIGLNAAMVRVTFGESPPTGYKPDGVIALPLLNKAIRVKAIRGAIGTYLSEAVVVVGYSAEVVR